MSTYYTDKTFCYVTHIESGLKTELDSAFPFNAVPVNFFSLSKGEIQNLIDLKMPGQLPTSLHYRCVKGNLALQNPISV